MRVTFVSVLCLGILSSARSATAFDVEFTFYDLPGSFSPITDDLINVLVTPVRLDAAGAAVRDGQTGQLLDGAPALFFNGAVKPSGAGKFTLRVPAPAGTKKQMVNIHLGRSIGGFTQDLLGVVYEEGKKYELAVAVPKPSRSRCGPYCPQRVRFGPPMAVCR